MDCKKTIRYLGAYMDGELSEKRHALVKEHLASCESCRRHLEEMLELEAILKESLPVPPLPEGLTQRIMAEARESLSAKPQRSPHWWPVEWIYGLSAPMKAAAVVAVMLALLIGISIDGRWMPVGHSSGQATDNLYGLEWFEPSPPSSITSVYISMAYEGEE